MLVLLVIVWAASPAGVASVTSAVVTMPVFNRREQHLSSEDDKKNVTEKIELYEMMYIIYTSPVNMM